MSQLKYYENGSWLGITPPELVTISATEPQDEHSHAILWVDTATSGIIPADYGVMDNLTTTASGQYVLDAHQGKILNDKIENLQDQVNDNSEALDVIESKSYISEIWNLGTVSTTEQSKSYTFTSHGRPVFICCSFCGQAQTAAGNWADVAIYRGSTHLATQTLVSEAVSHNIPGCVTYLDIVSAGTYTYNIRVKAGLGTVQFNESNNLGSTAPSISIFEI